MVLGKRYVPSDNRDYDEVGLASWYGPGFHGKQTANGEPYDMDTMTAAHKTLPMPSFVEVTNLANGRSVVVRVNDRGPFVGDRIIDLSRRAAQLLDTHRDGVAKVRVRRVYPTEREMARLKLGRPPGVAQRLAGGAAGQSVRLTAAVEALRGRPVLVQVAALADQGRAEWLAQNFADLGRAYTERAPGGLWRVRIGPFSEPERAATVLARVQAAGYDDARVIPATAPGS